MHQGRIIHATDLEAALKREPHKHLSLVHDPSSKWALLTKQANQIFHYRLTQHNLSQKDKESLMLAHNELINLAKSLKASASIKDALTEE